MEFDEQPLFIFNKIFRRIKQMRKPILMNDGDTKPAGMVFELCHDCKTALFVPQKSKIQLFFIDLRIKLETVINLFFMPKSDRTEYLKILKYDRIVGAKIRNSYTCPVCHVKHTIYSPLKHVDIRYGTEC